MNRFWLVLFAAAALSAQAPPPAVPPATPQSATPAPPPLGAAPPQADAPAAQPALIPPTVTAQRAVFDLVDASQMPELRWPDFRDYRKHLVNFYIPIAWSFAWTEHGRVTPQARAVIALFEAADAKGIHAEDYDAGRWAARMAGLHDEQSLAHFDVAVSITLMRYISDLHIGRINPRNLRFDLDIESKKYYLPTLLSDIRASSNPGAILAQVEPQYPEYRRLQQALGVYRKLAAEDANESPLQLKTVKPGDPLPQVTQLARMLRRVGDLPADAKVDEKKLVYEGALVAAVKRFQTRHGLEANGIIGAKTLAELNTPLAQRVKQIEWALERWRWAPMAFDTAPIIVNIPEFRLRGWGSEGREGITMNVVVGKAYTHQTPVFESLMKYLVFRPYWSVPPSIQSGELVPKVAADPKYLAKNEYEIVGDDDKPLPVTEVDKTTLAKLRSGRLSIRQKPGPHNALGLVKFMFPNMNNVYLHSTPSQTLFSRSRRDFSHGCIRVEDPAALAAWVLRGMPEWTPERIKSAMNGKEPNTVVLPKPIPILIIYTTAVVDDDGTVHFFEDIYRHDTALENALAAGYPYPA